jgi:SAM-dependent methyltransferase
VDLVESQEEPMSDPASQAQVEAAQAYEALFVASLFGEWAPRVAEAIAIQPGQRVLDVACGTGVLARVVRAITGSAGYVAGLDLNPGMLTVARALEPAVDWRQGEAESLPFDNRSFDAVVIQFGLMFFTDRHQALREMLRVLTPQGRLCVAVWDELASMPAYAAEVGLLDRLAGPRAADALRAPFVLGDREYLARIFTEAGARSVEVMTLEGTARFPGVRQMVEADLRGWLPVMGVQLTEEVVSRILKAADEVFGDYVGTDGRVTFTTRAHLVTATHS